MQKEYVKTLLNGYYRLFTVSKKQAVFSKYNGLTLANNNNSRIVISLTF